MPNASQVGASALLAPHLCVAVFAQAIGIDVGTDGRGASRQPRYLLSHICFGDCLTLYMMRACGASARQSVLWSAWFIKAQNLLLKV